MFRLMLTTALSALPPCLLPRALVSPDTVIAVANVGALAPSLIASVGSSTMSIPVALLPTGPRGDAVLRRLPGEGGGDGIAIVE